MIVRGLAMLAAGLLGGCISFNTPGDLAFVSADAVDFYDRPEKANTMADILVASGMVHPDATAQLPDGPSQDLRPKFHRLLLKVTFTSRMDLLAYGRENGYPIGRTAFFCDGPNDDDGMGPPDVYWEGRSVLGISRSAIRDDKADETPILYYVFIEAAREDKYDSIPVLHAYDLRKTPRDLCFRLRGGNHGFGYRSSKVRVPAEAIAEALKTLPAAFQGDTTLTPAAD